ncbi:MAG: uroporphyrinogen-III C-methyltransferase [Azospirillaceae bacterium]|nr:uroporphyrinogen-III C-methyltransferase [Azospirillaceae bacterium]
MTDLAFAALPNLPIFEPGWVWLAGAGPGDPGLLTLHAVNALRQADVIVYDALVSEDCLTLARPGSQREFAGKRGGKPSPSQPDITRRVIELAGQGLRVLRLKGGDPFVFGRGGEEALALAGAGIPFRIIPGVTAGIGGLAYAGIPVTHRTINSSVTFVTGHDANGEVPSLDWTALSRGAPVLVLYMAIKHLDSIAARLMAAGRPADHPVAVISHATMPQQRILETTLGDCVAAVAAAGLEPPALIVVGEAVRLRAQLGWAAWPAA